MFFKEACYSQERCIYFIKITVRTVILQGRGKVFYVGGAVGGGGVVNFCV